MLKPAKQPHIRLTALFLCVTMFLSTLFFNAHTAYAADGTIDYKAGAKIPYGDYYTSRMSFDGNNTAYCVEPLKKTPASGKYPYNLLGKNSPLHGKFYSMQNDLMRMGDFESFLVKGQFNCVSDNRTYKKPFIPIVTEYALLLKKTDSFIIPFSIRQEGVFSVQNTDILALTWHHLIRMTMESIGGRGALKDLYDLLKEHPKAKKNPHYQERIRATLYEHPDEYIPVSKGYFRLSYPVT